MFACYMLPISYHQTARWALGIIPFASPTNSGRSQFVAPKSNININLRFIVSFMDCDTHKLCCWGRIRTSEACAEGYEPSLMTNFRHPAILFYTKNNRLSTTFWFFLQTIVPSNK